MKLTNQLLKPTIYVLNLVTVGGHACMRGAVLIKPLEPLLFFIFIYPRTIVVNTTYSCGYPLKIVKRAIYNIIIRVPSVKIIINIDEE